MRLLDQLLRRDALSTTVPSLAQALSEVDDFRQAQGRRYDPLPILLLSCIAIMCGCSSQSAIADWAINYGQDWLSKLGFKTARGPSQSTLHPIFKGIDQLRLEPSLSEWSKKVARHLAFQQQGLEAVAIDGKTLCGSSKQKAKQSHLLSSLSHRLGLVLAQVAVTDKTSVKANQASLRDDCEKAFLDYWWMADTITEAERVDQHGDRLEQRKRWRRRVVEVVERALAHREQTALG
jgi:hypothetical protein